METYRLAPVQKDSTQITFRLPYTLGTHDGAAKEANGSVTLDLKHIQGAKGSVRVPIRSMDTDHSNRDCHMREALGLDYSASDYPEEHVCDSNDQLPVSGKNSVVHPDIEFQVKEVRPRDASEPIRLDRMIQVDVDGQWKIHGVTREVRIPMRMTLSAAGFRIQGESVILLQDYGVEVKSAKILIATISVGKEATVKLDLFFEKIADSAAVAPRKEKTGLASVL